MDRLKVLLIVSTFVMGGLLTLPSGGSEEIRFEERVLDNKMSKEPGNEVDLSGSTSGFFTENKGQWDDDLMFVAQTSFGRIGLGRGSIYMSMENYEEMERPEHHLPRSEMEEMTIPEQVMESEYQMERHIVKYTFQGSNDVKPMGIDPKNHLSNYFIGNDPNRWARGVKSYETVVYKDLYDDVDLKYYFSESGPKYDLILKPYADPEDIRIKVEGQEHLKIHKDRIEIGLGGGRSLQDRDLITYRESDDGVIQSEFKLVDPDTYGFQLDDYDMGETVVIDPLLFSTFLGGSGGDNMDGMTKDTNGNLLCLGRTGSIDFPTTDGSFDEDLNGDYDLFLTCLSSDGTSLLYSTYIGGNDYEYPLWQREVITDQYGNIYLAGRTKSTNFPTTKDAYQTTGGGTDNYDIFLLKLKSDGSDLLLSTYLGGLAAEYASAIIPLSGGDVIVGGTTYSDDFPTSNALDSQLNGSSDIFLTRINYDGKSLDFSTYIGGDGNEGVYMINRDKNGTLILFGYSYSVGYPTTSGCFQSSLAGSGDYVVTKLKPDGSEIISSTFIGGSTSDYGGQMVLDSNWDLIIFGRTRSSNFPTTSGAYDTYFNGENDAVLFKLKNDLTSLSFSTFLGGGNYDYPYGLSLLPNGDIAVIGTTYSNNFPTTPGAFDNQKGGNYDIFVSKFNGDGSQLIASTLIGGDKYDNGRMMVNDLNGKISVCGACNSTDLVTTPGAFNRTLGGDYDMYFVTLKDDFTGIEYGSYIGGTHSDSGNVYKDGDGNVFIYGQTQSPNFPTTPGAYDRTFSSGDGYVIKFLQYIVTEPLEVYSVDLYSEQTFSVETDIADINDVIYLELVGLDGNTSTRDYAQINISFSKSFPPTSTIFLRETNKSSGIYRGHYRIPLRCIYMEEITFTSNKDHSKYDSISVEKPFRPSEVSSVEIFYDSDCSVSIDKCEADQNISIELSGTDSNPSSRNFAFVNVSTERMRGIPIVLLLRETGDNTGLYRGTYTVPGNFSYYENLTIFSARDPSVKDDVMVHVHVQIRPLVDLTWVDEDSFYEVDYSNFGFMDETWTFETDADWLHWGEENHTMYGLPDNGDVGWWQVNISIEDNLDHLDFHSFSIQVLNTGARILTEDVTEVHQDEYYEVDYDSDEDGSGSVVWFLETNATWLRIDEITGVLKGTPRNKDVGTWPVIISVFDGNNATSRTVIQIEVVNVNDPPEILTDDITEINEGDPYRRTYLAEDIDKGDSFHWEFSTDAEFLRFDMEDGILSGTPGDYDVGIWFVNVTAVDTFGEMDVHNFTLTVNNVNDAPVWEDIPYDTEVPFGSYFIFDVNATDVDPDDSIIYTIETDPDVDIDMDRDTGLIEWEALYQGGNNRIKVTLFATDGKLKIEQRFVLEVVQSNPPDTCLIYPQKGERVSGRYVNLEWSGEDIDGDEITYDVYLSTAITPVTNHRDDSMILNGYTESSYNLSGLDEGETYYWTVIPSDYCSIGDCLDGVFSFRVNHLPYLKSYRKQKATIGEEFRMSVKAEDDDNEDRIALRYSLMDFPDGMELDEESGTLTWKPGSSDKGEHTVVFSVTDGIDTAMGSVDIDVAEDDGGGFSIGVWTIIVVIMVIVILAAIIFGFLMMRNQQRIEETESQIEANELEKEIERKRRYQEEYGLSPNGSNGMDPVSDVPLSYQEAHAHDHDPKDYSDQDLYGVTVQKREE